MKIAQVPPLYESVPPKLYGGTERVVSYLTEELVNQGHEVTLFGTGDSVTRAKLFEVCPTGLRLNPDNKDPFAWHIYQMQCVLEMADEFDVIHFHNDYLHYPFSKNAGYAHITTLHGRLDLTDLEPVYRKFSDIPVVSISNAQRKPLPGANWASTIYHGLPKDLYTAGNGSGGYLAFLGRISPEKRPDRAIEIAKRTGIPLKMAAKVDKVDEAYFNTIIKPMMNTTLIEYIDEINDKEKNDFLGNAMGLLFPIDWPEPFGMVMIEAMATGTPVIAFNSGSVPEVMSDARSGFVVNTIAGAAAAVQQLPGFDRNGCRAVFDERYTAETMTKNYTALYSILSANKIQKAAGIIFPEAENLGNPYALAG